MVSSYGAHPRVCGENLAPAAKIAAGWGSSPRVRGKLDADRVEVRVPGLIPACAGKTREIHVLRVHIRAHPRVCGENQVLN